MRACRLPQVSEQCYTLSISKHRSIVSDHELTTACVSGICYLKNHLWWFLDARFEYIWCQTVKLHAFWGCCHASIHCISIASTRIHRSHEAHDEGMAFDESTSAGEFLSHESTFFNGHSMMLIVFFLIVSSFGEKMEKKLHNWNSGLRCCRAWQGRSQPAYTVLTNNASERMFLPNSFI